LNMVLHHSLTELNLVICHYAWHFSFIWQISSLFGGLNTFLFIQLPTEMTFYLLFSTIRPFDVTKRSQLFILPLTKLRSTLYHRFSSCKLDCSLPFSLLIDRFKHMLHGIDTPLISQMYHIFPDLR